MLRARISGAESGAPAPHKQTAHAALRRVTLLGHDLWLKRFDRPRGLAAWRYLVRPSRGFRAFRAACTLAGRGLPTPPPLGYLAAPRRGGWPGASWFLYAALPGTMDLRRRVERDAAGWTAPTRARLARDLADFYLRLIRAGVVHADFKAENILVPDAAGAPRDFLLIDLDGLRTDASPSRYAVARNVVQLHDALGLCSRPLERALFLRRLAPEFPWLMTPGVWRRMDRWTRSRNARVPPCVSSSF